MLAFYTLDLPEGINRGCVIFSKKDKTRPPAVEMFFLLHHAFPGENF